MKLKTVCLLGLLPALSLLGCASTQNKTTQERDIGRLALSANDGWAALGNGTDGGSKASPANVHVVSNRAELLKAMALGDVPKIIYVKGEINLSVDDNNRELFEKDYADPAYDFAEYVKAYAPAVWNTKLVKNRPIRDLTGPQEEARARSAENQKKRIMIDVTSNTSIIGIDRHAKIVKGNLMIGANTENVIIRNITFEDAYDYFPSWDPGDSWKLDKTYPGCQENYVDAKTGPQVCPGGRWNSEYDNISINGGKRVWVDHCTFSDGDRPDKLYPPVFPFPHNEIGMKVQKHDGLLDITNGADLVTVSYNVFRDHDKTMLLGGSDSSKLDPGKLSVTLHHNLYENVGQRMPRVRFGKVHSYNNLFAGNTDGAQDPKRSSLENHLYALRLNPKHVVFRGALGVGKDSAIYSENNYFEIKTGGPEFAVMLMGGKAFFDQGSLFNDKPVDVAAAVKAINPKLELSRDIGWKPVLYLKKPIPARDVPEHIRANAGAGKL